MKSSKKKVISWWGKGGDKGSIHQDDKVSKKRVYYMWSEQDWVTSLCIHWTSFHLSSKLPCNWQPRRRRDREWDRINIWRDDGWGFLQNWKKTSPHRLRNVANSKEDKDKENHAKAHYSESVKNEKYRENLRSFQRKRHIAPWGKAVRTANDFQLEQWKPETI